MKKKRKDEKCAIFLIILLLYFIIKFAKFLIVQQFSDDIKIITALSMMANIISSFLIFCISTGDIAFLIKKAAL
jgi:hypothetical protein